MIVDIRQSIRSGDLWRGSVQTPSLYAMEMLERKLTQYARKATESERTLIFPAVSCETYADIGRTYIHADSPWAPR